MCCFFPYNRIFLSPCFNLFTCHFFEGPTPEPPPPKPCKEHLDVGVIIDSSNSISPQDYNIARQYIVQLAERLEISEAGTHMAILLYSWEAHAWHRLVNKAVELKSSLFPFLCYFHQSSFIDKHIYCLATKGTLRP